MQSLDEWLRDNFLAHDWALGSGKLLELGYSSAEIAQVEDRAKTRFQHGNKHFEDGQVIDAVAAFEEAVFLSPWQVEYFFFSGQALGQKARKYVDTKAFLLGEERLKEYLRRVPDDPRGKEVLADIRSWARDTRAPGNSSIWNLLFFDLRGRVFLGFCVLIMSLRWAGSVADPGNEGADARDTVVSLGDEDVQWLEGWRLRRSLDGQSRAITVKVEDQKSLSGLRVDFSESTIMSSQVSNVVVLRARIKNEQNDHLGRVSAQAAWFTISGELLGLERVQLRAPYASKLRQGDHSVFGGRFDVPPKTASVRVSEFEVQRAPIEPLHSPPTDICVSWSDAIPPGASITARVRQEKRSTPTMPWFELEIENTGVNLVSLKARLAIFTSEGTQLTQSGVLNTMHINHALDPLFKKGEKRVQTRSVTLSQGLGSEDGHRVCLDVMEARIELSSP